MALPGAWPMPAWSAAALVAVVVLAAATDLRSGKVPNWLTYPAILLGLAGHALFGGLAGWEGRMGLAGAAAGFAVGFLPLLVFWLAGGIGAGDAKLMGAIGAMGGWEFAIGAMLYGFITAALMAIVVMIRRRVVRRTLRRMYHAVVLLVTPGAKPGDPTAAESPRIPFAVALCIGTVAAMLSAAIKAGGWFWAG